jgi:hypothetical protein
LQNLIFGTDKGVLDASQVFDELAFAVEHVNAMAKVRAVFIATAPSPILFHLTPHSGRRRVLELEPVCRPSALVGQNELIA